LTLPTGLPAASDAITTGCWANTTSFVALLDGCVDMTSWASGPASSWILPEVAVAVPDVNFKVRVPTRPLIARLPNVATPEAFVITVAVPPRVPPPVAIDAVTPTPATGLLPASRTSTEGCRAKGTLLWAVVEGCVRIASAEGTPVLRAITSEVAAVRPVVSKRRR
jgi:hypothetical protein